MASVDKTKIDLTEGSFAVRSKTGQISPVLKPVQAPQRALLYSVSPKTSFSLCMARTSRKSSRHNLKPVLRNWLQPVGVGVPTGLHRGHNDKL